MGHLPEIVTDLALILIIGAIVTVIFKRIKQPVVLGYILAGFLISPAISFFPSVHDIENINVWAEIGVIFLMFGLGLEFSLPKLIDVGSSAIITAMTEMILMIGAGVLCGLALGWNTMNSLFLGGMLAISSTTIIIKAFEELDIKRQKFTTLVFGTLVVEDIAGIFLMVLLSTIAVSTNVSGGEVAAQIGQMALYLVLWFVLSIFLVPTLLKKVDKYLNDEILLVIAIALCFGMVVLANYIGFSAALGAFIAGSILAGTTKVEKIEHLIKPVKDLFGAVFFVSVGMLVEPAMLKTHLIPIIAITLLTIIGKPIFTGLGVLFSGQPLRKAVKCGFSLSQVGEFSFIIASLGLSLGVTADFLYPVIVSVSVVTTLITPFMIKNSDWVYNKLRNILPKKLVESVRSHTSEKQSEIDKDSDWKEFLKRQFSKIVLLIIVSMSVVEVAERYIQPIIAGYFPDRLSSIVVTIVSIIVISPFIANAFSQRKDRSFTRLWFKARSNHLPLAAMSLFTLLVSVACVCYAIFRLENVHALWIFAPAIIFVILVGKSDWVLSKFLKLEVHFISNLNEKSLNEDKLERVKSSEQGGRSSRWVDEQLYVASGIVKVAGLAPKRKAKVADIYRPNDEDRFIPTDKICKRIFDLNTIKIKRNDKIINFPNDGTKIVAGDEIVFLGTKDSIETFFNSCDGLKGMDKGRDPISLHQFIDIQNDDEYQENLLCYLIKIDRKSKLKGKSIKASKLIEEHDSLLLGIERNDLPILDPDPNFVMKNGDYVWLLGSEKAGKQLAIEEYI